MSLTRCENWRRRADKISASRFDALKQSGRLAQAVQLQRELDVAGKAVP